MRMLQTHASAIFSVVVFILMRFRLIRYVCVFVLIHFQESLQIDAFSMQTLRVLVWTEGLNASNNVSVTGPYFALFDLLKRLC